MKYGLAWILISMALAYGSGVRAEEDGDAEKHFKESMALTAYARVEYRDAQDRPIAFGEFMKRTIGGESFGMRKDSDKKLAVVSLEPKKTEALKIKDGIEIGAALPKLTGATLDGKPAEDAVLPDRHTLLSFYFAECVPCIGEVPALNDYAKAHPEVGALAVTFDTADDARAFVWKHGLKWPVLADSQAFIDGLGMHVYPTLLLIGPDRKIMARYSGSGQKAESLSKELLENWVKAAQMAWRHSSSSED